MLITCPECGDKFDYDIAGTDWPDFDDTLSQLDQVEALLRELEDGTGDLFGAKAVSLRDGQAMLRRIRDAVLCVGVR